MPFKLNNLFNPRYAFKKQSHLLVILFSIIAISLGLLLGDYFAAFSMNRKEAAELLKDTLSNFIALLGIGLAILAVLLAVIQLAYKRLNVVSLVIENTYFIPLAYFGLTHILVCATTYLYFSDPKGILPDLVFIRIVVIEQYLFILTVLFLGFVFYRTFTYTNFTTITDLYISNVKRLVSYEKQLGANEELSEDLQVVSVELKSELEVSIEESRFVIVKKIIDLYLSVQTDNPNSNLLKGFKYNFSNWLIKSYKLRNLDILHSLVRSWWVMYKAALVSGNPSQIDNLRFLAKHLFETGIKESDADIKNLVIDFFPIRLKELATLTILEKLKERNNAIVLREGFLQIQPLLLEFSELLNSMIKALDINATEKVLIEFDLLSQSYTLESEFQQLKIQKRLGGLKSGSHPISKEDVDRYTIYEQFYFEIFAIRTANLGWLLYELIEGKKDYADAENLILLLANSINEPQDLFFKFSVLLLSSDKQKYLWDKWVWYSEERQSGKTYTLENEELFLALGIAYLLLVRNIDLTLSKNIEPEILQDSISLSHWLKDATNRARKSQATWIKILKIQDDQIESVYNKLEKTIKEIEDLRERQKQTELAIAPLSESKVDHFRVEIYNQWRSSNTLTSLFEFFDAVQINPEEKLQHVGLMRINFEKAKFLFTDVHHHPIYGIEWGHQVNQTVNDVFVEKVLSQSKSSLYQNYPNLLQLVDSNFKDEPGKVILLVPFHLQYFVMRDLENTGRFKSKEQFVESIYPFDLIGIYNEKIVIVPLRSEKLGKSAIAFPVTNSILVKRRKQSNWMGGYLQVDVIEITQQNAKEIAIKKFPGKELDADLLNEILSGVFIEINETLDFEILDSNKIIIFQQRI